MISLEKINKIFLLGDLHLGIRNNSVEWANSQKSYLIEHFLNDITKHNFNEDTDILIQEGDWFHNREHTNNRIWSDSLEILSAFYYMQIKIH